MSEYICWSQTCPIGFVCELDRSMWNKPCSACRVYNCAECQLYSRRTCDQCNLGYSVHNNLCKKCSTNCASFNADSNCLTCVSGFKLEENTCKKCPDNCLQ
ncbi:Cysteine-rich protein [Spironucleus salmonicida]|uniref:Cysteine-rich protein n=1 Tax=Spironucleus salmonicida TaxID=348837 RepID=A0A9P8RUI1_9EUKA|nr:Cysteine-rich protein [Spironucleus salmonicida]